MPAEGGEHDGGKKDTEASSKSKHHPLLLEVRYKYKLYGFSLSCSGLIIK